MTSHSSGVSVFISWNVSATHLCEVFNRKTRMIVKFGEIPGKNLTRLLNFIHGKENRVNIPYQGEKLIVRPKEIKPDNQAGGIWYSLTLDIVEWLPNGDKPGKRRVDPKYLLKVYRILGKEHSTRSVTREPSDTKTYPPISLGMEVLTTQANMSLRKEWTDDAWKMRQWNVRGIVVDFSDAHGLCYEVQHPDNSTGYYDPSELRVVTT